MPAKKLKQEPLGQTTEKTNKSIAREISPKEIRVNNKVIRLTENKKWETTAPLNANEIEAVKKII